MNEKFKELADQVGICRLSAFNSEADDESLQRFAEAIVKENAVFMDANSHSGDYKTFGDLLKAHYGVE